MYKDRLYILNNANLRKIVMDELHQSPYSTHPSYRKVITLATQLYFWLGMKIDIAEYISKCQKCQRVKVEHQHLARLLQPLAILEWKWEIISMDFITKFPMTLKHHDSIMSMVDKLYKATHFILVKSTHKTSDIEKNFIKEFFKLHGLPKAIVSNLDAKFNSNFWKGLFQDLGTHKILVPI